MKKFLFIYLLLTLLGIGSVVQIVQAEPVSPGAGGAPVSPGSGGAPVSPGAGGRPVASSGEVQSLNLDNIDPLHGATIEGLLERIIRWLRNIAAPIAAGMIIYGAYQMLFAAGDPEKFKVGRQTILYTVIGYAIIWIGWGITKIIEEFLSTP